MADEHPVVTLLVARMGTHPEEFFDPPLRWEKFINDVRTHALPEDTQRMQVALSALCMERLHANVIDELLNGDERRAALAEQAKNQARAASVQNVARQQAKASALGAGYGSVQQLPMTAAQLQQQTLDIYNQMNALGQSASGLFDGAQNLIGKRADMVVLDDPFEPGEWLPLEAYPTNKGTLLSTVKRIMKGEW